jgi:hypothetical protein
MAEEQARTCIRAADMRARGASWTEIMHELNLLSPAEAKKTVEAGYGLAPGEDYRMGRRKCFDELNLLRREAWKILEDPGPATTVSGKVITDPLTGMPVEDRQVKIAVINTLRAIDAEERKLGGYDAPKQTVTVTASSSLDEINAHIAKVRAEVEAAEAAALSDTLGDGGNWPPALPPGA